MLELTARHADAWNLAWFGLPDERLARMRVSSWKPATAVGRDPSTSDHRRHHRAVRGAPRPREGRR
jgi:hypothetical protein